MVWQFGSYTPTESTVSWYEHCWCALSLLCTSCERIKPVPANPAVCHPVSWSPHCLPVLWVEWIFAYQNSAIPVVCPELCKDYPLPARTLLSLLWDRPVANYPLPAWTLLSPLCARPCVTDFCLSAIPASWLRANSLLFNKSIVCTLCVFNPHLRHSDKLRYLKNLHRRCFKTFYRLPV